MNLSMIKKARELQKNLAKVQKDLGKTVIEVESGKGAIKVKINGQQKILSLKISPEVINPDKAGNLEKLIMKAIEEATDKSQKMASKEMKALTGGLNIPGLT